MVGVLPDHHPVLSNAGVSSSGTPPPAAFEGYRVKPQCFFPAAHKLAGRQSMHHHRTGPVLVEPWKICNGAAPRCRIAIALAACSGTAASVVASSALLHARLDPYCSPQTCRQLAAPSCAAACQAQLYNGRANTVAFTQGSCHATK